MTSINPGLAIQHIPFPEPCWLEIQSKIGKCCSHCLKLLERVVSYPGVVELCTYGAGCSQVGRTCLKVTDLKNSRAERWRETVLLNFSEPLDVAVPEDLTVLFCF